MNNVQEIITTLENKNDELQKALDFKIEENAALKKIIKNIDDDSKQYKEKVTQKIEETLTHRSVRNYRKSPDRSLDLGTDFFDDFE